MSSSQSPAPPAAPAKSLRKNSARVVLSIVVALDQWEASFFVFVRAGVGREPIRTIFYILELGGAASSHSHPSPELIINKTLPGPYYLNLILFKFSIERVLKIHPLGIRNFYFTFYVRIINLKLFAVKSTEDHLEQCSANKQV